VPSSLGPLERASFVKMHEMFNEAQKGDLFVNMGKVITLQLGLDINFVLNPNEVDLNNQSEIEEKYGPVFLVKTCGLFDLMVNEAPLLQRLTSDQAMFAFSTISDCLKLSFNKVTSFKLNQTCPSFIFSPLL